MKKKDQKKKKNNKERTVKEWRKNEETAVERK